MTEPKPEQIMITPQERIMQMTPAEREEECIRMIEYATSLCHCVVDFNIRALNVEGGDINIKKDNRLVVKALPLPQEGQP